MTAELIPVPQAQVAVADIAAACVARLSASTQRAYGAHITDYLTAGLPLTRESILGWLDSRKADGAGPPTLNIAISAFKLLAREVWIRGLLPNDQYNAIADIRSEKSRGKKLGQWTDETGVEALLAACTTSRERALIAIMAGCGLRRAEVAGLRWSQYQMWHGRRVWVDILGKGGKYRSVPVPEWASDIIDIYRKEEGIQ